MTEQHAEMAPLVKRFSDALDCCGTCAGGVLAQHVREAQAQAWGDGYNDAVTMARSYGHTDYWENEPSNPYERPTWPAEQTPTPATDPTPKPPTAA